MSLEVRTLDLSHGVIKELEAEVLTKLTFLKILKLNHNKITVVPEELSVLGGLEEIDLTMNRIEDW